MPENNWRKDQALTINAAFQCGKYAVNYSERMLRFRPYCLKLHLSSTVNASKDLLKQYLERGWWLFDLHENKDVHLQQEF